MDFRSHPADFVTWLRILLSIVLFFLPVLSTSFFVIYILTGVTDIADGIIARATDTVSEEGSILATAADAVFAFVCLYRLIPLLHLPFMLYVWIAVIAAIKVTNVMMGFKLNGCFPSEHLATSKIVGAMLFLFPLTQGILNKVCITIILCAAATVAAIAKRRKIKEGHINEQI